MPGSSSQVPRPSQFGGSQVNKEVVSEEALEAKVIMASEILDEEIVPDSQSNIMANPPPLIVKATGLTKKCKGCGGPLSAEDKQYPHDMVFHSWWLLQPEIQPLHEPGKLCSLPSQHEMLEENRCHNRSALHIQK